MEEISGAPAEALWWDSAQFVHDLRNRMTTIDTSAGSFLDYWPRLIEVYDAAVERGEVERPIQPREIHGLTKLLQIMRHEAHLGRELLQLHWERIDGGLSAPEATWKGDGGETVRRARERVSVEVTGRIEGRNE